MLAEKWHSARYLCAPQDPETLDKAVGGALKMQWIANSQTLEGFPSFFVCVCYFAGGVEVEKGFFEKLCYPLSH